MKEVTKFEFDIEFQMEILKFTVNDIRYGQKIIPLYRPSYFELIEHSVVATAVERYFKKTGRVPSKPVLIEEVKAVLKLREFRDNLSPQDKEASRKLITKLYRGGVKDPVGVYEKVKEFARFCATREVLEDVNLEDFQTYPEVLRSLTKAINTGVELEDNRGIFIIKDARSRISSRKISSVFFPTPFWQINRLLNNGGTATGNIIVVFAPAKRFKTGFLLNLARGYLRLRKRVLVADFENGEDSLATRVDQSIANTTRKELLSGNVDDYLMKTARKYARFGAELVIKRFKAGETAADIGSYIRILKDEHNIQITDLIVDYPDVMGDSRGTQDDTQRISWVYIDLKNLGQEFELNSIWAPSHVNRGGEKNQNSRFSAADSSKSIDKVRHADMLLGINQDDNERDNNVLRIELVDQRDGPNSGRAMFYLDADRQRLREFTVEEVKRYEEQLGGNTPEVDVRKPTKRKDDL